MDPDQFAAWAEPAWIVTSAGALVPVMGVDVQPKRPKSPGRLEAKVVATSPKGIQAKDMSGLS
ncbi:hypothetical protein [Paenirhodobacter populi]|uniref:hypothetical protein n=1 Tax=Paenirhodobacter populi TaxID=2306993 RepID=UPI000FE3284A|nr:hypothetical protein [Sinirhodobacter populi]RWR07685.1 hypothetical protein D2T32_11440 [Sinirhodobacter populi]